jgi:hypothetical protein
MPDDLEKLALGACGDFGRERFFLLLEGREFDFDEAVKGKFLFHAGKEGRGDALVAYFEDGFETLSLAFEAAAVGRCKGRLQGAGRMWATGRKRKHLSRLGAARFFYKINMQSP